MLPSNRGAPGNNLNTLLARARNSIELRNLVMGSTGALIIKAIGALAGFALAVILARFLGAHQAGVYYTALQFVVFGAFFGRMALDLPVMRETAQTLEKDTAAYRITAQHIGIITATGTTIVAIVFVAASPVVADIFNQAELAWLLPAWIGSLVAIAFFNLFGQAVRGTVRISESSYFLFASVNIVAAIFLAIAWVAHSETSSWTPLQAAVVGYSIATAATAIGAGIRAWTVVTNTTIQGSKNVRPATYRELLESGVSFLLYGLSTRGLAWAAVLILAAFHGSDQVAIYTSAYQITLLVAFVLNAVVSAVGPRFSQVYRSGDRSKLRRLLALATGFTSVVSVPVVIILFLYSKDIMSMYGPEFVQGAAALNILLLGQLVSAATGPAAQVLIAANHERSLRNISVGGLLINLTLHLSLVPPYGFLGSAIATSVTVVLLNIAVAILAWRLIGSGAKGTVVQVPVVSAETIHR